MKDRATDVYRRVVEREFAFLKSTSRVDELHARGLPLRDGAGLLVPVCELHADDERTIELLARWREQSAFAFPTRFAVTYEGTRRWLRAGLLDVPGRILFLVLDRHGHPVGHLGFAQAINDERALEVDNVVRGEADRAPGIMGLAMEALLEWAHEVLHPERIFLRVLADNPHAARFYRRLGFVETRRIALRRHEEGDRVSLEPLTPGDTEPPDAEFVVMEHRPAAISSSAEPILTAGPSISAREVAYALDAVRRGWNRRWNGYLEAFERAFADYVGARYALATSSCTGALHLALLALGLRPGDEVIVPDLTWVATANAVAYTGATPVFADIEPESWCLDPVSVEELLTERTRAIVPVHLYGHPAQMDAICAIADRHGLSIVEDAAPALGAEHRGRRVGTYGNAACFSFQGAKLLVTGEGGMLVTDDGDLYERARHLWDQGREPGGNFAITALGWKYKLSNVQAAIGLAQLERCDGLIEAKRRIFSWYSEELKGIEGITLASEADWARSTYWMTSVLVDPPIDRETFRRALADRGIDTRPVFPAISQYPIWGRSLAPQPTADAVGRRGVNLPSGVCLRREQVAYVGRAIRESLAELARRAA